MKKFYLFIFLIFYSGLFFCQKNYTKDIEKEKYSKVIKKCEKTLIKDPENIQCLYFLALIKSRKNSGKYYNTSEAYNSIIKSKKLFSQVQDFKSLEFFSEIPINYNKFQELLDSIASNAYSDIKNSNDLSDFEEFLQYFLEVPSIYLKQAKEKKQHLKFVIALSKNDIVALENFIQENPDAIDIPLAVSQRDVIAFNISKDSGDILSFEKFIASYPLAKQVDSAYFFIYELAYSQAIKGGDSKTISSYLNKYPKSHLKQQALQKKDDYLFLEETDGTIQNYIKFCKNYKNSSHFTESFEHINSQVFLFKNIDGAYFLLENKKLIKDPISFQENLFKEFLFDGNIKSCLDFESIFYANLDQSFKTELESIKSALITIDQLYLKIGLNSNNYQQYDDFIKALAPKSIAFVALQRLIESNLKKREYKTAKSILSDYETYFNDGNINKVTELLILLNETPRGIRPETIYSLNTSNDEYAPVPTMDGKKMYFCGKDRFDNYGGEDIYVSLNKGKSYKNTAVISSLSTKSLNEAPLSISADGNTMFLWSSQNKGDIQSTTLQKNGSWSAPVTLPYPVNSDYYEGDAMLSADGNSFIFVSSRPGGYNLYTENTDSYHGDDNYPTDIYLCKRMYGNSWSEPINLGKKINTPFSERSPYLHPDGKTLYFSSDGHTGFGRMDVFKSIRQNDSTFHEWSKPLNLGKEINSTTNDWGFKFATDGSHAYYSGSANSAQKSSLLLVLDISGSMDGTKLDAMKKAAKELCLNALENNTEIAIYAFEGECEMPISDNIDFTNDPSELTFFIDELTALGGTPMYEALKDGLLYLKENSALDSKNKSIILLSDGDATSCISRDELFMNIRKEKTFQKVFTIALEVSENSQAFQDLKAISIFTKGEFYHAESSEDLGDAFAKASNTIFNFSSKNSNSDLYKIQIPSDLRPAIVSTISGIIMSTSKQPIEANILWEDLSNGQKIGSAKSNPVDGSYFIALPTGKNYGYFVDHPDYFPTSNNVDLRLVSSMQEIILDISPVSYDEMIKQSIAVAINNIFFETNKFDLKYESNSELDRVIEILKRVHFLGIKLEISGHTDNVGEADFNMELSRKRAEAVANYIIKQGFDPSSLEVKGYGLTRPVKDNSTVYNRSKNRRVELRVISKN